MSIKHKTWFELLVMIAGGVVLLFVVGPVLSLVLKSSPLQLADAAVSDEVRNSIMLTLGISMAGTLLFAIPAVPLAWLLARSQFRFRKVVLAIIDLPVVIPHTAAGIALLTVLNRQAVAGKTAEFFGFSFIGEPAGIMIAMAYVSLPLLINSAREGFAAVPLRLETAAALLGASPARIFFTVALPLAWRSVVTGAVMMFARGLSEFGAVIIIAYHPMVTSILMYDRLNAFGLANARGITVLFVLICLIIFIGLRVFTGKKNHAAH